MKVFFLGLLLTSFSVYSAPIPLELKGVNHQGQFDSFAPFDEFVTSQFTLSNGGHAKHQGIMGPFISGGDPWEHVFMRDSAPNDFYQPPAREELRTNVRRVPEPASMTLMGLAMALLALTFRRGFHKSARHDPSFPDYQCEGPNRLTAAARLKVRHPL